MTGPDTRPIRIREASRDDNAALLALTATSAMGGRIAVRIDRGPDFFRLIDRRGAGVLLVAEHRGSLVGSLSATVMPAYVGGREDRIVFLGDFKVSPAYRGSGLAVRLLRAMQHRMRDGGPDVVLGLTARDNQLVQAFHGGRARLLTSVPLGGFRILQMMPRRQSPRPGTYRLTEELDAAPVLDLYRQWASGYQFAPVVSEGYLAGSRHLVARAPDGTVVAALALVDVSDARQNALIRLPWFLRAVSSALRGAARVLPIVPPPAVGDPVRTLYVKAIGVAGGHEPALAELLQQARYAAGGSGYHFLSIGLHEHDPLGAVFRVVPAFTFDVTGFIVSLRGDEEALRRLLNRTPYQDFSLG